MLSDKEVFERLIHLINYQYSHIQKQCYAISKSNSIHIFGIGFDRWHFISRKNQMPKFLVSLFHFNLYHYINYSRFPCPIMARLSNIDKIKLYRFVTHKNESWLNKIEKQSSKKEKEERIKSHILLAKKGLWSTDFVNKIGKKKKR